MGCSLTGKKRSFLITTLEYNYRPYSKRPTRHHIRRHHIRRHHIRRHHIRRHHIKYHSPSWESTDAHMCLFVLQKLFISSLYWDHDQRSSLGSSLSWDYNLRSRYIEITKLIFSRLVRSRFKKYVISRSWVKIRSSLSRDHEILSSLYRDHDFLSRNLEIRNLICYLKITI